MLGRGRFLAPKLNRRARETWAQDIFSTFPDYELFEWDFKSLSRSGPPSDADVDRMTDPSLLDKLRINDAKIFFYTGGEHLFSYAERDGQDWDLLIRLAPLLAGHRSKKKVVILPATFGPFETPFARRLAVRMLEATDVLAVRDLKSQETIGDLMGSRPPYGLDPAFFISPGKVRSLAPVPLTANLIMRLDHFGLRTGAAASKQRAQELELNGYQEARSYQIHREVAAKLLLSGVKIRLFVQCLADDAPARSLLAELDDRFPGQVELKKPTSPESFISELGGGHITLTSRFHGAIFSLLASRQAVALYFDDHGHKMPGLFDALGMSRFCFNASHEDPQTIADMCCRAMDEYQGRDAQIDALLASLRLHTIAIFADHMPKIQRQPPL